MSDVFISYSRCDIDFVRHLFDQLTASRPEQVTENAKAADIKLGSDVLARLDAILIDRSRRI